MEGLGDRAFRRALIFSCGGVDEACTSFIRVPGCRPPTSVQLLRAAGRLARSNYDRDELGETPLAAQLMGSDPVFLAAATAALCDAGAARVDLNCGCPASTVTGRGAGSSLLRQPEVLTACLEAMVAAAHARGAVVSVKLRSGFNDTHGFESRLAAVAATGVSMVTLHPRTRLQGYSGRADWGLVAEAVRLLHPLPVVGSGDVTTAAAALAAAADSGCAGVMLGRGAAADPLLFRRIRAARGLGLPVLPADEAARVVTFLHRYWEELGEVVPPRSTGAAGGRSAAQLSRYRLGKLKQLCSYLLRHSDAMAPQLRVLLRTPPDGDAAAALERATDTVWQHWNGPPVDREPLDSFSNRHAYANAGAESRQPPVALAL